MQFCEKLNEYMNQLNERIGTDYKPFNYYGVKDAKYIIISMGSVCDTIKQVVTYVDNYLFGLIEVHLYRPFSKEYLLNVLPKSVERIAVLDRTKEQGSFRT